MRSYTLQPAVPSSGKRVQWTVAQDGNGKANTAKVCGTRAMGLKVLRATLIQCLTEGLSPVKGTIIEQSGYTEVATYRLVNPGNRVEVVEHNITPPKPGAGLGPRCRELGTPREAQALRRRTLRSWNVWSNLMDKLVKGEVYATPGAGGAIGRFWPDSGRGRVKLGPEHFALAQTAIIQDVPGSRTVGAFPPYAEPPAGGLVVPQVSGISAPESKPAPKRAKVAPAPKPRPAAPKPARPAAAKPARPARPARPTPPAAPPARPARPAKPPRAAKPVHMQTVRPTGGRIAGTPDLTAPVPGIVRPARPAAARTKPSPRPPPAVKPVKPPKPVTRKATSASAPAPAPTKTGIDSDTRALLMEAMQQFAAAKGLGPRAN